MAATVVDSLVVTLGLDPTTFQRAGKQVDETLKATRDNAATTAKVLEARGKQAAEFFSQIKTEALGLVGVFLGGRGLEQFARDATTSMAALGREAANIGTTVPALAAFRNAVERNGGSADAAAASMRNLTDQVEKFKVGQGDAGFTGAMASIGGNISDDPATVLAKFAAYADLHKDNVPQVNLVAKMLGLDQGSVNELRKGALGLAADLQESYRLGVPTAEMARRSQQLQHDFIGLGQAAEGVGNKLLTDMQPGLSLIATEISGLIVEYPRATEAVLALVGAFTAFKVVMTGLEILTAIANLGKIATGLRAVAAAQVVAGGAAAGGAAAAGGGAAAGAGGMGALLLRALPFLGGVGGFLYGMRPTPLNEDNPHAVMTPGMTPPSGGGGGSGSGYYATIRGKIYAAALTAGVAHPDVVADLGAAQSVIETGGGKHVVGNNYFGIKSGGGVGSGSVSAGTSEYEGGAKVSTSANFAAFGSMDESAAGYVAFLKKNPRYAALLAAGDRQSALAALQASGYATDPLYGAKVGSVMPSASDRLPSGSQTASAGGDTHINVKVGDVHTQAKDAGGIARDLGRELNDSLVTQANRGLS